MIERRSELVDVLIYDNSLDEMGLPRQSKPIRRQVPMYICNYKQTMLSDDIRFKDVEYVGLTREEHITDNNQIIWKNAVYNILGVIPSGRYNQVLLKKTNV